MRKKLFGVPIKVLYIGNFNINTYPRGRVIYKGLLKNNVSVDLILTNNVFGYLNIFKKLIEKNYDIVLCTGKPVFLLSCILKVWHRKKIIFDVFISDYENLVLNRKTVKKNSVFAKILFFLDKHCCEWADKNILDTDKHINYFSETFGLNKNKFSIIFVGADEEIFFPCKIKQKNDKFKVVFYGSFIPGHGIDVILRAAKILEKHPKIQFDLIGFGPLYEEMVNLSRKLQNKNVSFLGWLDQKKLPEVISNYDVCLGLFDKDIAKVQRVIPTKVFEITALKKPLITGRNISIDRYYKDKKDILFCEMGNDKSLADAIITLYKDEKLRQDISKNGCLVFKKNFNMRKIGFEMKKVINNLIR